jgi:diacylglycerol kinase family enzyme
VKPVVLIVNPVARGAGVFQAQWAAMEALLRERGYEAEVVETTAEVGAAERLAAAAAARGAELVLACGGDGTVHGVVQGLARSEVALGVIPLGTANALARNLGLPMDPTAALRRNLEWAPRRIALGRLTTATAQTFFCLMAGCGPDGALVHALAGEAGARLKRRFGRLAYYGLAAKLFGSRRWPVFRVELRETPGGPWQRMDAVAMMGARVPDLGGAFGGLARRTPLFGERLRVQVVAAPGMVSMPMWMATGYLGLRNPWVRTLDVAEVRCMALGGAEVQVQADAEAMGGGLPVTLTVVPAALSLVMP